MRRHLGSRHTRRGTALERHRLPSRPRRIRRRHSRTRLARPRPEHRPGGRPGPQTGRCHPRRSGRYRRHPRPRSARFAAGGRLLRQRLRHRPGHPHHGGQPPAGSHPGTLRHHARPARRTQTPLPVPVPARIGRQLADRTGARLPRHGDPRQHHRRRSRRSIRQMRQNHGTALSRRPADRQTRP